MVVEEVNHYLVSRSVHLLVACKLFVIAYAHRRKYKLRQLREYAVIVVLTDGKVDVVASNHVDVEVAQLLYMLPLAFVLVLHLFGAETIPQLQKLHHILCCLLEHNEPVYVPSVESNSVLPVQDEFSEKFEDHKNYLIVGMECIQSSLNDS